MRQLLDKDQSALEIFYCYAHEDKELRDKIDAHLVSLHRSGLVSSWHDAMIIPGTDWEQEIKTHLDAASIILLLVSPDFLNSDYCYGREMQRAIERHTKDEAQVIPILLRPVDWEDTPFSALQVLPTDAKPITQWSDKDAAFADIARGIRRAVNSIIAKKRMQEEEQKRQQEKRIMQKQDPVLNQSFLLRPSLPLKLQHPHISRRTFFLTFLVLLVLLISVGGAFSANTYITAAHQQATIIARVQATTTAAIAAYNGYTATNGMMYGFNASHTNTNPYERVLNPSNVGKITRQWTYRTGDSILSSPAVVNGVVYIGSYDGTVYVLDAITGAKKWAYQTSGWISSSPAVANGVVYIGSDDHNVYALDAMSRAWKGTYKTGNDVAASPAVVNGMVYINSLDHNVYAFHLSN